MIFPLSTIATTLIGIIFLAVSIQVIKARRNSDVSLGDGGDEKLLRRMRAQANLVEYGPIGLLLLFFAESHGTLWWFILLAAVCLVIGRAFHAYSLGFTDLHRFTRFHGTLLTLISLLLLILINLVGIFAAIF